MELAPLKAALETSNPGLVVQRKLGEGGEGEVFLARLEPSPQAAARGEKPREVALKLLKAAKPARLKLALKLKHPRIVEALTTGEVLGLPYLLMEFFPGEPLRARLQKGPLPLDDLRTIFVALTDALEHAHGRGIVHQDVKPENVLALETESGLDVKLADFGLATELEDGEKRALLLSRSLRSGEEDDLRALAGTLPYLAPERLDESSREPDARADI
ncbi:protein kinase, partial [bacterium]|nr:protein kinase [bacterium]